MQFLRPYWTSQLFDNHSFAELYSSTMTKRYLFIHSWTRLWVVNSCSSPLLLHCVLQQHYSYIIHSICIELADHLLNPSLLHPRILCIFQYTTFTTTTLSALPTSAFADKPSASWYSLQGFALVLFYVRSACWINIQNSGSKSEYRSVMKNT